MTLANTARRERLSDPHAELPIKNHKYVKNCTELYLANRRIERIANFESFVNLEVLWINENQIEHLDGLDSCIRLKQLYVQNNRIRTLDGCSLLHFKFLNELRLYDNKLKDLQGTLDVLSRLPHLHDLDLFGNAVMEEENYRLQVIRAIPSLHVLDRHVITDQERIKAARLQLHCDDDSDSDEAHHNRHNKTKKKKQSAVVAGAPPQELSGTVKMLFKEVAAIKREQWEQARAAAEREQQELTRTQQQALSSTSCASSSADKKVGLIPNLDEWETASLKKHFHTLEEQKNSGILKDNVELVVRYLRSRGYAVSCDGVPLEGKLCTQPPLDEILPKSGNVRWNHLLKLFEAKQLRCTLMSPQELRQQAARCFDKCALLQRRLQALATGESKSAKLIKESHELSQQGYHLQALVDRDASSSRSGSSRVPSSVDINIISDSPSATRTPRSRFYMTAFSREKVPTPSLLAAPRVSNSNFHELKEESMQIDETLAKKYKIRQKDFTKYLLKQTPHTTKLVRHNYRL